MHVTIGWLKCDMEEKMSFVKSASLRLYTASCRVNRIQSAYNVDVIQNCELNLPNLFPVKHLHTSPWPVERLDSWWASDRFKGEVTCGHIWVFVYGVPLEFLQIMIFALRRHVRPKFEFATDLWRPCQWKEHTQRNWTVVALITSIQIFWLYAIHY